MKILKQGRIPLPMEYVHTCIKCSTVFLYTSDECIEEGYYNMIECPYCGRTNIARFNQYKGEEFREDS